MFNSSGPHFCLDCPSGVNRKGHRYGHKLKRVENNYSGTGADIAECTSCGRTFQITYKVDQIIHVPQFETERNG